MDNLLNPTLNDLTDLNDPSTKVEQKSDSSNRRGRSKLENQVRKLISKRDQKLLDQGQIELWQVSLRNQIHIKDLQVLHPNLHSYAPDGAPTWAGGKGLKFSKKTLKALSKKEMNNLIKGVQPNSPLFPWEGAILHCQNIKRIISLLSKEGVNTQKIKESPSWIPAWAQLPLNSNAAKESKKLTQCPVQIIPENMKQNEFDFNQSKIVQRQTLAHNIKTTKWNKTEKQTLAYYWKLDLLGSNEIAALMERCPINIIKIAKSLGLPKKPKISTEEWCGIRWQFTEEGEGDPRHLNPNLQRLVAETSATRFSLLYETAQSLQETDSLYRKIQKELNQILELHTRIFSKYLLTRSRKYKFLGTSAWQVQKDLEQAGQTAIFECLRRWHPNRNIRFSRGTVNIAINREMLAWLEQQRLVELPDKIRSVARKLKQAHDRGNWESEVSRLKKEAGENCVREASKHQNTYAFLHTVPLMETYDETEAEHGGVTGGNASCIENFTAVCMPQNDTDVGSLLIEACSQIPSAERRAVLAYHGINDDGTHGPQQTLEEIGSKEGVTKERIRQRILKAKQRMRRWLERKNIKNVYDALSHA